jgi:cytochrome d ubiquinol oxidase subunit II
MLAAVSQGLILGALVDAVPMQGGAPFSGRVDPIHVLGIPCAIGLIGGYSLLGASWLIWKTESPAQVFGREVAYAALILSTVGILTAIAWRSISEPAVAVLWLAWPNVVFATPALLVSALLVLAIWRSLWSTRKALPFVLSAMLFIVGLAGISIGLCPFVVQAQVAASSRHLGTQPEWYSGIDILIIMLIAFASQLLAY